ncbi:hypothetical protein [Georgenia sp. SUBG003]|uniref:hypothetical protein n=1 Tax=Georgenia sp. SUBG003 TaxID=1497974 RepID=UPI003AB3DBB3
MGRRTVRGGPPLRTAALVLAGVLVLAACGSRRRPARPGRRSRVVVVSVGAVGTLVRGVLRTAGAA